MTETLEALPHFAEITDFIQYSEARLREIMGGNDRLKGIIQYFGGPEFGGDTTWPLRYEPSSGLLSYTSGAAGVATGGLDSDINLLHRRNVAISAWRIRAEKAFVALHGVKVETDAEAKLDALWAALEKEAIARDWCSEYDTFAAENGGPPRKRTRKVHAVIELEIPLTGYNGTLVRQALTANEPDFRVISVTTLD